MQSSAMRTQGARKTLRGFALALAVLTMLPAFMTLSTISASASTKNANLDGTWSVVDKGSTSSLLISGENVTKGTFGGSIADPGLASTLHIVASEINGNSFTFTLESEGTVVGENGSQIDYAGTVNGNKMSFKETAARVWKDGKPVEATYEDPGPYPATRESVDLSGTITFGCSGSAGSCPAGSGPLYDAKVDVEGPTIASTTTDTKGQWSIPVSAGHYTITPSAPDATFSPDSLEVDVTKSTGGQDFTSCSADSTVASNIRAPLVRDNVKYPAGTLIGDFCSNYFRIIYSKSTNSAIVTWTANRYICNPDGTKFYDPTPRKFFKSATVGSSSAPGNVSKAANNSVHVNVNRPGGTDLVLEFDIAAGGLTGTVSTTVSTYPDTATSEGVVYPCLPVEVKNGRLPFFKKKP